MDPQQRVMPSNLPGTRSRDAAIDPARTDASIGVFVRVHAVGTYFDVPKSATRSADRARRANC